MRGQEKEGEEENKREEARGRGGGGWLTPVEATHNQIERYPYNNIIMILQLFHLKNKHLT